MAETLSTLTPAALILIAGILTSLSDLSHQKIRNHTLAVIGIIALLVHLVAALSTQTFPMALLQNLLMAIALAGLFFIHQLWRAGDAKLFILYALLMPPVPSPSGLPWPCLILFANTFIASLLFLIPWLMRELARHYHTIGPSLCTAAAIRDYGRALLLALSVSWITFPILQHFNLKQFFFIPFAIIYLSIKFILPSMKTLLLRYAYIFPGILAAGLWLHYILIPEFFQPHNILSYLLGIFTYIICAKILYEASDHIATLKDRVPFAPFLFIGCLLSYTPFLATVILLIKRH